MAANTHSRVHYSLDAPVNVLVPAGRYTYGADRLSNVVYVHYVPLVVPTAASSKSASKKTNYNERGEDIIQCKCGITKHDLSLACIACDSCGTWQHNECVGISSSQDETPDSYVCEECTASIAAAGPVGSVAPSVSVPPGMHPCSKEDKTLKPLVDFDRKPDGDLYTNCRRCRRIQRKHGRGGR